MNQQPEWVPELAYDVVEYSAFILYTIATQHPFAQANKRTTFAAAENCLLLCGMRIVAGDMEIDQFMRSVANGALSIEDVKEWIKTHAGVDNTS